MSAPAAFSRDDLLLVAVEPVVELEVTRRVRVGQRVAHEGEAVVGLAVERVAGRAPGRDASWTGASGHVAPDLVGAVPVDDPCDSAHKLAPSLGQDVEVFVHVPVAHVGAVPLPFVPLVVHEHTVHVAG